MCEELEKVMIDVDSEKHFQVGVQLPPWEKEEMLAGVPMLMFFPRVPMKLLRWIQISFVTN